jgi:hypothetical protein
MSRCSTRAGKTCAATIKDSPAIRTPERPETRSLSDIGLSRSGRVGRRAVRTIDGNLTGHPSPGFLPGLARPKSASRDRAYRNTVGPCLRDSTSPGRCSKAPRRLVPIAAWTSSRGPMGRSASRNSGETPRTWVHGHPSPTSRNANTPPLMTRLQPHDNRCAG